MFGFNTVTLEARFTLIGSGAVGVSGSIFLGYALMGKMELHMLCNSVSQGRA